MNRDRFACLVRDTITTLCQNELLESSVKSVQGLLGITLKTNEVLLINIQEAFQCQEVTTDAKLPMVAEDINVVIAPEEDEQSLMDDDIDFDHGHELKVKTESIVISEDEEIDETPDKEELILSRIPPSNIGKLLVNMSMDQQVVETSFSPEAASEQKEFHCPFEHCSYTSKRKYNLERHVHNVHEGLRAPCSMCDRTFSNQYCLRQHQLVAHEVVQCPKCPMQFTTASDIKTHMKTHCANYNLI